MKFNTKSLLFALALISAGIFAACGSETSTESADETENTEMEANQATEASADQTSMNQQADPNAPTGPTTTMVFEDGQVYDYGVINAGEKVKYSYKLKNTGSEPLIISNCKGSCGCTVPVCPTAPIAPGETAEIPVEFDSKGKNGPDTKTVTITANTNPSQTILTIKGEVKGQAPTAVTQ